ncbi:hypothetical protein N8751_00045 [bacterium]|nr:hypothetical protein [bacterium]
MYDFIVNPETGRKVNIHGKTGKKVLKTYKQIGGIFNLGRIETKGIKCKGKILNELGRGTFKTANSINCEKDQWTSKSKFFATNKFNKNFTQENCQNSTIVITNEPKKQFYKEIDIQRKLTKKPKIYQYGKCKDTEKFDKVDEDGIHYKIEEKFTDDLQQYINDKLFFIYKLSINPKQEHNFKQSFKELFEQIKFFNKKGYGHFDIKPANIGVYLTDNGLIESLNFIDFGLADKLKPPKNLKGTLGFLDPVGILYNKVLTKEMDLFALGMTLLNTLFDKNPIFSYLESLDQDDYINGEMNLGIFPKFDESSDEWIRRIYKVDSVKKDNNQDIIECNKFCKNTVKNKSEWRKCYLKASRKYHPDKQVGKNDADKASSSETFKVLQNCDEKMNEELLSSNVIEKTIFEYPITLNLIYYLFVSNHYYRYSVEQILNHSFWNSNFDSENEDWIETPEYKLRNKIISDREERIKQLEAKRVEGLVNEFGRSELGCHCAGPCGYQNICDAISGLCSHKKKCPVEPEYCDGEDIDRCGINR